jgi:hypothetical protein
MLQKVFQKTSERSLKMKNIFLAIIFQITIFDLWISKKTI